MKYYDEISSEKIKCLLCKHYCKLNNNSVGICGVNKNIYGKLGTLVYGYPSAINIDPIEKKPLYHFLPNSQSLSIGTVGCNMRCPFCQNWHISQTNIVDRTRYFSPQSIVDLAIANGCESISYTYNEPAIFYPYAKDIGMLAKEAGIKNIFVSSGFESSEVLKDMASFVDAVNIDLKSFDKNYYKKVIKADLNGVLETLKFFAHSSIHLEITTLIIDTIDDIEKMANFIYSLDANIPYHLSAFYPNYKMQNTSSTDPKLLIEAKEICTDIGLKYTYIGNIPYSNNTDCPNCDNILVMRSNYSTKVVGITDDKCSKCGYKIKGVWK